MQANTQEHYLRIKDFHSYSQINEQEKKYLFQDAILLQILRKEFANSVTLYEW